jgi:endo-1,4-beta-xylanase
VRLARTLAAGFTGLALLAVTPPTVLAHTSGAHEIPADSLRALAEPIGLEVGVAINPGGLENERYNEIAATQFSSVTPENEMKWETVEPRRGVFDYSAGDRIVRFAQSHDQLVRGHTLLWHNQLPAWLTKGVSEGSIGNRELKSILRRHVKRTASHFAGKVWAWDVANEFFTDSNPSRINPDNFWVSRLGRGIIGKAFRWAHEADPTALLFYNDYNIAGEDGSNAKADAVYRWAKRQLAKGVPIDGIGDQGHLDTQFGFPTRMEDNLRRYARLGLKVAITEADVRTFVNNREEQQPTDHLGTLAQPFEFSEMLKACLAVKACVSFTVWGVGDAYSWVPGFFTGEGYALIYDVNLQPKHAYTVMQEDLRLAQGAPRRNSR